MLSSLTLVTLLALLPAQDPAVAGTRKPYSFITFGDDALGRATLVVEATAQSVLRAGHGVAVARFEIAETLLGDGAAGEVTVLAPPDEFHAGVTYLLFLVPYRAAGRYTALRRVVEGDRDYQSKLKVLRQFAQLQQIVDVDERARRIRDTLIANLRIDNVFIRWNALTELSAFVRSHKLLFENAHRAALVAILEASNSPTFTRALREVLKELGVDPSSGPGGLPE